MDNFSPAIRKGAHGGEYEAMWITYSDQIVLFSISTKVIHQLSTGYPHVAQALDCPGNLGKVVLHSLVIHTFGAPYYNYNSCIYIL